MNQTVVKLEATLTQIRTLRDKSVRIQFDTQELFPEQASALFQLRDQFGFLGFANFPTELEVPESPKAPNIKKTKSRRLRGAIYRLWEQTGKNEEFEDFYNYQMEVFIECIKERLD